MARELNRWRAAFVLGKIDEILAWARTRERICARSSEAVWTLENLKSFDEFLEKRFPDSRRKAYYLMAIHKSLTRVPKRQLREVGWNKAIEQVKATRKESFDCATWFHKAKELQKDCFKGELVSVLEPSTEVIRKRKASKPTEFGKMVKVQEAENQIITYYEVFEKRPNDADLLLPAVRKHAEQFGRVPQLYSSRRRRVLLCGQRSRTAKDGRETNLGSESLHEESRTTTTSEEEILS